MRTMLNRHIPLDAIARWWYVSLRTEDLDLFNGLAHLQMVSAAAGYAGVLA